MWLHSDVLELVLSSKVAATMTVPLPSNCADPVAGCCDAPALTVLLLTM
jgi:hypothetical protein